MPTDWCTIGQARVEVVKGDVDVGDVDLVVGARLDEAELKGRGGARLYVDLPKLPFDAAPSAAGGEECDQPYVHPVCAEGRHRAAQNVCR